MILCDSGTKHHYSHSDTRNTTRSLQDILVKTPRYGSEPPQHLRVLPELDPMGACHVPGITDGRHSTGYVNRPWRLGGPFGALY
jgi:hypothetical protein